MATMNEDPIFLLSPFECNEWSLLYQSEKPIKAELCFDILSQKMTIIKCHEILFGTKYVKTGFICSSFLIVLPLRN